ncbi:pyridoxamine 5'-phosphate oxidase family protein [Rhizobacter sp. LjRoot28]|jgi:general stress protein 26|uniref:pyridoxamine 5'-phosphate oxidase family protein n=1 Tax=Rhizobacter sp. LjRoot28 TaxID=3342309 RepID=UPI003ECF332A
MSTTFNDRDTLWELIEDIKFAMFTTRHANGHLHSRPMTTQNSKLDEQTSLWFFVGRDNELVEDIATDPQVNVAYGDPGSDTWVSVSGEARLVEDRAKKEALWSKMTEAWFPGGIDDPNLGLLEVQITHAHYWDVKDSKLVQLIKMATSAVTGNPPKHMGETGEVRMK